MKKNTATDTPKMILPDGRPFKLHSSVEQTDQFQADFLGAYGDMIYSKKKIKRQTIIACVVFAVFSLIILLSDGIVNQYLLFTGIFGAIYLLYGIYFCTKGYQNDFKQLQRHLEAAVDKGLTVYETEEIDCDFQDNSVYLTYQNGVTRYFLYEDIRYFEETDRFYIFGMKYRPREKRLANFERALFTKDTLTAEQEEKLKAVIANVTKAYDIKPVLESHPFK